VFKELRQFIIEFFSYFGFRLRQVAIFTYAGFEVIAGLFSQLKSSIVSKMFWGRGSFYRTSFHIFIFVLSALILVSGVSSKLSIFGETANGLGINDVAISDQDIFSQSGTAQSLIAVESSQYDYVIYKYEVQRGDTLASIAKNYSKNINTLVWANKLANANTPLAVGQQLSIPEIDGAFYTVKKGDTLEKVAKATKAEVQDILDFNTSIIDAENPTIAEGMNLFVPGGEIVAEAPPKKQVYVGSPIIKTNVAQSKVQDIPKGTFISPMVNCPGYSFMRGFSLGHHGADMALNVGCWESAAAPGKVIRAGWGSSGEGYNVVIDHGNGIKTRYYHGERRFAVQVGDEVKAGQPIMFMGSTGNSTGRHLHFEIVINNLQVNPERYVCLRFFGC
jgi:murein DD-endopeptidase MepM/ murein hydrolase activator NlpD